MMYVNRIGAKKGLRCTNYPQASLEYHLPKKKISGSSINARQLPHECP